MIYIKYFQNYCIIITTNNKCTKETKDFFSFICPWNISHLRCMVKVFFFKCLEIILFVVQLGA